MKKKIMAAVLCFVFVCALAVGVSATTAVFTAGQRSFTGVSTGTRGSYTTVQYKLYGEVVATSLTCQVYWHDFSGNVTTGKRSTNSYSSSLSDSDARGPSGTYPGGSVTHTAVYNGDSNSRSTTF